MRVLLFLIALILISCGKDEDTQPSQQQPVQNPKATTSQSKKATQASTEVGNQIQFIIAQAVSGWVEFKKPHRDKWEKLKVNHRIKTGFIVKSSPSGTAKFTLPDGSTIALASDSEVSLEELAFKGSTRNAEIYLSQGELLFNIKKLATKTTHVEFTTPTATAAIRGTKGAVSTNGKSSLAYLETGKLELKGHGNQKSTTIGALESTKQTSNGFLKYRAKNIKALKTQHAKESRWMKSLKSPVIQKLYSPKKTEKYFKKQLEKKFGKSASKFISSTINSKSISKSLKNEAKKQIDKKVTSKLKSRLNNKMKSQLKKNLNKKTQSKLKDAAQKKLNKFKP